MTTSRNVGSYLTETRQEKSNKSVYQSFVIYAGNSESEADLSDAASWFYTTFTRAFVVLDLETKGFGESCSLICDSTQYKSPGTHVGFSSTGLLACEPSPYIDRLPLKCLGFTEAYDSTV